MPRRWILGRRRRPEANRAVEFGGCRPPPRPSPALIALVALSCGHRDALPRHPVSVSEESAVVRAAPVSSRPSVPPPFPFGIQPCEGDQATHAIDVRELWRHRSGRVISVRGVPVPYYAMTMMECSGTPCCNGGAYVFMFEASPTPLERQSAGRLLVRRAGESGVLMAGVQDCELPLYLPLEKAEIVATGILRRAPLDDAEYGNASLLTEATLCVSNPSAKGSAPPQAPSR